VEGGYPYIERQVFVWMQALQTVGPSTWWYHWKALNEMVCTFVVSKFSDQQKKKVIECRVIFVSGF
jgi:hypothetical protein